MSINYQVFSDISDVSLGSTDIHGVESVKLIRRRREFRASGDGQLYDSAVCGNTCEISGSIITPDLAAAEALDGLCGTLSFVWKAGGEGNDKTVTITNITVMGVDIRMTARNKSSAQVYFSAASPDGITDPVNQ